MVELIKYKQLLPLLSNNTIYKLSNTDFYEKNTVATYLEELSIHVYNMDIDSIRVIEEKLIVEKRKYSDIFMKRFSLLNNMHFNLKETVKKEVINSYNKNKNTHDDVDYYKELEKSILDSLKSVFQENSYTNELTSYTYDLLIIIVEEVINSIEHRNLNKRCVNG